MLTNFSFLCFVSDHVCPRQNMHNYLLMKLLHILCARFVHWAGSTGTNGSDFMNNRSRLPPEGSAKEEHLYGIKAMERME